MGKQSTIYRRFHIKTKVQIWEYQYDTGVQNVLHLTQTFGILYTDQGAI